MRHREKLLIMEINDRDSFEWPNTKLVLKALSHFYSIFRLNFTSFCIWIEFRYFDLAFEHRKSKQNTAKISPWGVRNIF